MLLQAIYFSKFLKYIFVSALRLATIIENDFLRRKWNKWGNYITVKEPLQGSFLEYSKHKFNK